MDTSKRSPTVVNSTKSKSGKSTDRDDNFEMEYDKQAKATRENEQLVVYIFVSFIIALAWIMGTFELSFIWVFMLIVLVFAVWWGKVMTMTEKHIKLKEMIMHRKRALRQSETAEWLNFVINRWWVFSSKSISDLIKINLDPHLQDVKPAFLESIELQSFSLGDSTPYIKYVQVYECVDGKLGGKRPVSWSNVSQPPPSLPQVQQYQLVLELDVGLQCDDFKMIFRSRFGGRWLGSSMDVALEKLNITGKMQLVLHLDMDTAFPHIKAVTVSFLEKPEVWFAVRMLKAVQMMEIPILKSWLHTLVMDGLTQALVDPGKIDIKFESTGPTNAPAKARSKSNACGVLTVTLSSEQTKPTDKKGQPTSDQMAFIEDVRYCSLTLGDQRSHTQNTQGGGAWEDTCSFLVENIKTDKLIVKSKSKILLSTYTLAQFELPLANYPFEHKQSIQSILEEKIGKRQGGGTVKLDMSMEYTPLSSIEREIERGITQPKGACQDCAGVMYVCVHFANNLLGLDRNGFSDPYCVIYCNGKKIKTTHYICRTKNPKWEVSAEFIVADYTKSMLSFIVYDWDGRNASEDDFLGSAHILLSKDEPSVIRKNLTLGYNLLNVGQVDNQKLGTVTVSVLFRPVASVSKSETSTGVARNVHLNQQHLGSSRKGLITTATEPASPKKQRLSSSKEKKSADMGVGAMLSLGHGILELNILQAKDLVAMDSNGFSDPYCEVRINNERKFTTSIKKKTLHPVWDEWVTTQLPKPTEMMEIVVWDRDAFFQKDFLGSVMFTPEELKKLSTDSQHDGWFQLQRIRSGYLQLRFKVISQDAQSDEQQSPVSYTSESTDSGLHNSASPSPLDEGNDLVPEDQLTIAIPDQNLNTLQAPPALTRDDSRTRSLEPRRRNKKSTQKLNRSASDLDINARSATGKENGAADTPVITRKDSFGQEADPKNSTLNSSLSPTSDGISVSTVPQSEMYCGVQGRLMLIKGLEAGQHVYCKLRLDSRTLDQRTNKFSQGRVFAKSDSVQGGTGAQFNLKFDVDSGMGVPKESLLIFDVKVSHREHLATRGYMLQELLADDKSATRWLPLEKGIELQLFISTDNETPFKNSNVGGKSLLGFMNSRSRSFRR